VADGRTDREIDRQNYDSQDRASIAGPTCMPCHHVCPKLQMLEPPLQATGELNLHDWKMQDEWQMTVSRRHVYQVYR